MELIKTKTFYQKKQTGAISEWKIEIVGNTITTRWGQLNSDKIQEKVNVIKSKGKEGTKSYKSPDEQALIEYNRELEKRLKNGYFYTIQEAEDYDSQEIDLNNLPAGFHPAKPISKKPVLDENESASDQQLVKALQKIHGAGRLLFQRKANGIRGYLVKTEEKGIQLYSRTLVNMTTYFPYIIQEAKNLDVPNNSMLDMELTINGGYTLDDCMKIQSLAPAEKTLSEKNALSSINKFNTEMKDDRIECVVFDVIFWDGEDVNKKCYDFRFEILQDLIHPWGIREQKVSFSRPFYSTKFNQIKRHMIEQKWEGLVIWDLDMIGGYTLNGKPKRLKGCWKWKNVFEDDFFILEVLPEKGDDSIVGAFRIGQFDIDGNVIDCGKCASGITKEMKHDPDVWNWVDEVIEARYNERMKPNDKGQVCLQFARFVRRRMDKKKEECIYEY